MTQRILTCFILIVFMIDMATSRPQPWQITDDEVLHYLIKYGYLDDKRPQTAKVTPRKATNTTSILLSNTTTSTHAPPTTTSKHPHTYTKQEIQKAVTDLQTFFGLNPSGKVDHKTVLVIQTPRCGEKDRKSWKPAVRVSLTASGKRKIRSALNSNTDKNKQITMVYRIPATAGPPPGLASGSIDLEYFAVDAAFNIWASVTNLKFLRHTKAPWLKEDIYIMFKSGDHGDGMPFGNKNDLGHVNGAQIHLDYQANWEVNQLHTVHYRQPAQLNDYVGVLAHELGHVLGLKHSTNKDSLMFPTRSVTANAEYKLHETDMQAIQNLYGTCWPNRIDAVESFPHDGKTYFFIGPYVYRFNDKENRVDPSFPMLTQQYWGMEDDASSPALFPRYVHTVGILPCCPSPLDYNWFIFSGDEAHYYYMPDGIINNGWPQKIPNAFTGVKETRIDASLFYSDNKMYLFSGDLVYRWDHTLPKTKVEPDGALEPGWPKKIKDVWPGVPDNLDAAFRRYYDGKTYFFKGKYFYIWDEKKNKADCCYSIKQWQNLCDVYQYDMSTRKTYSIYPQALGP